MSFKILRENNYLPSMIFCTEKSLFKIVFYRTFKCQPIFKLFAAHFRSNSAPFSAKKILCQKLNEIENICEIPLSESRKHTLGFTSVCLSQNMKYRLSDFQ